MGAQMSDIGGETSSLQQQQVIKGLQVQATLRLLLNLSSFLDYSIDHMWRL